MELHPLNMALLHGFPWGEGTLPIGTPITPFIMFLGAYLEWMLGGCVALSIAGTGKTLLAKAVAGEVPV